MESGSKIAIAVIAGPLLIYAFYKLTLSSSSPKWTSKFPTNVNMNVHADFGTFDVFFNVLGPFRSLEMLKQVIGMK
jgi:hypothetical protein